ncbi:MAG: T9SS type A sorting domain-containing protein [Bacteroidota bacterium]
MPIPLYSSGHLQASSPKVRDLLATSWLFTLLLFLHVTIYAQSPGGVSTPTFWYEAGEAGLSNEIRLPEDITSELQIFTVYQKNSQLEEVIWSLGSSDTAEIVLTNHRLAELDDLNYLTHEAGELGQTVFLHTFYRRKVESNGMLALPKKLRLTQAQPYPELPIENHSADLLEIILYDRVLSPTERQQIESYLALKYGLTIKQNEARHYIDSESQPYWDAQIGSSFGQRIAGIGRDIDGSLLKTQGRSQLPEGNILTISTEELSCDLCYLSWSDNGEATAIDHASSTSVKTLYRTWQIQSRTWNRSQTLSLQLDSRSLYSIPTDEEQWHLIIDPSGSGHFDGNEVRYIQADRTDPETGIISWDLQLPSDIPEVFHLSFGFEGEQIADTEGFWKSAVLSPNPSPDGHYQVRVETNIPKPLLINTYDQLGRLVKVSQSPVAKYHLVSDYLAQSGTYRIEITADSFQKTLTLIIP